MRYKKPTLVEVYIECHLDPGALEMGKALELVPRLKALGLQDVEMTNAGVLQFDLADRTAKPTVQPRLRCWNEDRTKLAQFGDDFFAVNLVGEYPGWDEVVRLLASVSDALAELLESDLPVMSASYTTIDKFEVSPDGYSIEQYLECGGDIIPKWYRGSSQAFDVTLGHGLLQHDGFNRQIRAKARVEDDVVKIELRVGLHERLADRSLEDTLDHLHDQSNATFESMVTDRTRSEIMEGAVD